MLLRKSRKIQHSSANCWEDIHPNISALIYVNVKLNLSEVWGKFPALALKIEPPQNLRRKKTNRQPDRHFQKKKKNQILLKTY